MSERVPDFGQLDQAEVGSIVRVRSVADIKAALTSASRQNCPIVLVGLQRSQGGHIAHPKAIALDMTGFNKVHSFDPKKLSVRVQAGATWNQIQQKLNPHGFSLVTMQSSCDFTVGGSISSNIHGRDIRHSSIAGSIRELSVMLADGEVVTTSPDKKPELFNLIVGGLGLFGVILEAELDIAPDVLYEEHTERIAVAELPKFFADLDTREPMIEMAMARPSIAPGHFLRDALVTTWRRTEHETAELPIQTLGEETHVFRDRLFFGLSRRYGWGKSLRWFLEATVGTPVGKSRLVSRNNAMRPPIAPLAAFLNHSPRHSDHTQEFFIPVANFNTFIERADAVLKETDTNVLAVTVRFIKGHPEPFLNYTHGTDRLAVMMQLNDPLDNQGRAASFRAIRRLVDAAISCDGCSYLTYALQPTAEQLTTMYPDLPRFLKLKQKYDPDSRFTTNFYRRLIGNDRFPVW